MNLEQEKQSLSKRRRPKGNKLRETSQEEEETDSILERDDNCK